MSVPGAREPSGRRPWFWIGAGLALATASTLVLEIVLTRIFSVILWYHYGFMTISLALLGLGLAGVLVYLYPERFPRETAAHTSAKAGLAFAATSLLAILVFHWIVSVGSHWPLGLGYRTMIFLVVLVPFFFAGLAVAIPISRFAEKIGPLYAADLLGAAVGAVAVIPLIAWLGGHAVVIATAALACTSAAAFSMAGARRSVLTASLAGAVLCVIAIPMTLSTDLFRIRYSKHTQTRGVTGPANAPLAERWNSFSRVTVSVPRSRSFGWKMGKGVPEAGTTYLAIKIDGGALTPMIAFDGNLEPLEFLRYDITALGYRIRRPRTAMVIGSGGGRDLLTARLFDVPSIHAVEVNPIIVDFVRNGFRDFSGSPYDLPGVTWTVADGRSYAAESDRQFDVIQVAAVDTTAALAAGALTLVENSLYTVEAFEDYYDRLTPDGLLAVTRNWNVKSQLMALRLADIMRTAWERRGHERPEDHLVIIGPGDERSHWGTLLASRRPFEPAEVEQLESMVDDLGFRMLYRPGETENPPAFRDLFGDDPDGFLRDYPYDVAASTDDRPFFFFFHKPFQTAATPSRYSDGQDLFWGSRRTPRVLLQAFLLVSALVAVLSFGLPLRLGRLRLGDAAGALRGLLYFAGIGLGFIMAEIALIQRYTLLLGQPLYAFSGTLSCILVCSGLGSLFTLRVPDDRLQRAAVVAVARVALVVVAYALLMPPLLREAMSLPLAARVAITLATIAPLGFVMGMPLPLGMRLLRLRSPHSLAWGWGINGSLSVMGTVLAMVTSVFFGITTTMLTGAAAYGVAMFAFGRSRV